MSNYKIIDEEGKLLTKIKSGALYNLIRRVRQKTDFI